VIVMREVEAVIDAELRVALAPVLCDVAATTAVVLEVTEARDDLSGDGRSARLVSPHIASMGVWFVEGMSSDEAVAEVAGIVQEVVIKELWRSDLPVSWPPCPLHPNAHPLEAGVVAGRSVWRCPKSSAEIVEIGSLGER
jgi:hypothetical protein